jgi:hypothetical protein
MQLPRVLSRLFYALEAFLKSLSSTFVLVIGYLLFDLRYVARIVLYLVYGVSDGLTHFVVGLVGDEFAQIAIDCFESRFLEDRRIVVVSLRKSSSESRFFNSLNFLR